jgi:hypothetical protein
MNRAGKLGVVAAAIAAACLIGGLVFFVNSSASANPDQPRSSAPANPLDAGQQAARDRVAAHITQEGSVGDLAAQFAGVDLGPNNGLIVYAAPSATDAGKSQVVDLAEGVPVTFVAAPYSYAQLSQTRDEITAMKLPNVVDVSIGHVGQYVQIGVSEGVDKTANQLEAKFPGMVKVVETSPAQMGVARPPK